MGIRGVVVLATAGLALVACSNPEAVEELIDQQRDIQSGVACILLEEEARVDPELPRLIDCTIGALDDGVPYFFSSWGNPARNAVDNNLSGDDYVFAPVEAASRAYAANREAMPDVQRLVIGYDDDCRNVIEVPVALALQIAEPGANTYDLLENAEFYGLLC